MAAKRRSLSYSGAIAFFNCLITSFTKKPLPARLHNAWQQTLVSHFPENVARQTKIAVIPSRATCHPTAIPHPHLGAVAGQLLNLAVNFNSFLLSRSFIKLFQQRTPFISVFSDRSDALFFTLNHALLCHE
jgi:hypothetical protein